MNQPRIWHVITDGGRARIVRKRDGQEAFDTLREMVSADLHHATRDLGSERPGRARESATTGRHAVEPRQDLHEAEKHAFAHEVAAWVNTANTQDEFDALVLIAPAHALADLRQALDEPARRKITGQLQKDLTKVPNADLAAHLGEVANA